MKRLPRLARIVRSYLRLFDPRVSQNVEFMERTRLKGKHLGLMRKEVERITERRKVRAGFTLVEMLVAVGLVVLMMTLFATVFQVATSVMTKQKGMAENDQRARTMVIVLKGDLDKRTFRRVTAMGPAIAGTGVVVGPENASQQGYFYYSENDPYDDTDDVLQFTANSNIISKNVDTALFYGRANVLRTSGNTTPAQNFVLANPNQPEADDGQAVLNNAASSDTAEIAYFLRNGILYRRIMLVRKPLDDSYEPDPENTAPPAAAQYLTPNYTAAVAPGSYMEATTGNFWADFDFSCYHDSTGVRFHAVTTASNALNNGSPPSNAALNTFLGTTGVPAALATPNLRFGHSILTGMPREYATSSAMANGNTFLGRLTHEETSHSGFTYPGATPTATNDPGSVTLDLGTDGIATTLAAGPRRGEDIVLTNVYSFDVKIFDDMDEDRDRDGTLDPTEDTNGNGVIDRVMDFRDLGYVPTASGQLGYYWHGANLNPSYGPKSITAANQDGTDGQPGVASVDDDGDGTVDNVTERGWPGSDDPYNRVFDTWHSTLTYLGTGTPPFRPVDDGADGKPGKATSSDDGDPTIDYTDTNMNGVYDPGEQDTDERGFAGSDDRHPVRSIQIKIRYLDTTSNQFRTLTIVHSLVE